MPYYINPNPYIVPLVGADGLVIRIRPHSKIELPAYFDRYVSRGLIRAVGSGELNIEAKIQPKLAELKRIARTGTNKPIVDAGQNKHTEILGIDKSKLKDRRTLRSQKNTVKQSKPNKTRKPTEHQKRTPEIIDRSTSDIEKIVGIAVNKKAHISMSSYLNGERVPLSNNIGVGILSYQRYKSLKRLVTSIRRHTNIYKTTVFISDDGSTDPELVEYLNELDASGDFTIIRSTHRLGVAGNSNRLLRCLSRFKYGILLNDDVEVLDEGWEYFYTRALEQTGMHHLMLRQNGIYGAKQGVPVNASGIILNKVDDKPQGAVLVFTHKMLNSCGYFNEQYGLYGMEHVDWSAKAHEFGLQQRGFYDVMGSDRYMMLHDERSAVSDREASLAKAKAIFKDREPRQKVPPSAVSAVDEITYIIPFRDHERTGAIKTVLNNIRAQRFPVIHIIISEQDVVSRIDVQAYEPVSYVMASKDEQLFNKSYAFNQAVVVATSDKLILHDADMMTFGDYARKIWQILEHADACHIGSRVLYTDKQSCEQINITGEMGESTICERVVGYYEGGSLACTKRAYWRCGAFNEDFYGYGCEDCDFYKRLSESSNWCGDRDYDLIHLWHSRVEGWNDHHDINKELESYLKKLSVSQRINKQITQLKQNGYGQTLREMGIS